jgi:hypothetical protein
MVFMAGFDDFGADRAGGATRHRRSLMTIASEDVNVIRDKLERLVVSKKG